MLRSPLDYTLCLKWAAHRDGLRHTELRPVMMSEILAVESELRIELPKQYEDFLAEVGVGEEFDGLAVWLHLDLTQRGSLVEVNKRLWEESVIPRSVLVVYDPLDGELYGFKRSDRGRFDGKIYRVSPDPAGGRPTQITLAAGSFVEFLESIAECSPEELEMARRDHITSSQEFAESPHTPSSLQRDPGTHFAHSGRFSAS